MNLGYIGPDNKQGAVAGTDGRLDVSSRVSSRAHYVSRDDGQAYTVSSHDATAAAGTYILYLQNVDATDKIMTIDTIKVHAVEASAFKVWFVTGTASASSSLTAVNLNKTKSKSAAIVARGDGPVTIGGTDGEIWAAHIPANSESVMTFGDALILGQNDAIAIEIDTDDASPAAAGASVQFYLETPE